MSVSKEVIFVRHGECQSNRDATMQAGTDEQIDGDPLTDKGIDQATKTGEYLAEFPQFPIEAIISSGALRARMTAAIIAEKIQGKQKKGDQLIQAVPLVSKNRIVEAAPDDTTTIKTWPSLLREIDNPSELVGLRRDDPEVLRVKRRMDRIHSINIRNTTLRQHYSDEENLYDQWRRAKMTIDYIEQHPSRRLIVVAHGGLIKLATANAFTRGWYQNLRLPLLTRLKRPIDVRAEIGFYNAIRSGGWFDNAEIMTARFTADKGWQIHMGFNQHLHRDKPYIANLRPGSEPHSRSDL